LKSSVHTHLSYFYRYWELAFVLISATILVTAIASQYIRYAIPINGLYIGWDTPDYVRLGNDVLIYGPAYTIGQWHYPQLYVLSLALVGSLASVDNAERVIPLVLGSILGIANYLITLRVSSDRKIAAIAAILTPLILGNLKLVGDSHRNLMAYAILLSVLASGFPLDGTFKVFKNPKLAYVPIGVGIAAFTQFETFALFGMILVIASIIMRKYRMLLEAATLIGIPTVILFLLFPSYLLGYFGTPTLLFRNPINGWDLIFWTGGTILSLSLLILGGIHVLYRTLRKPSLLVAVLFSWFAVTMLIFWAIALKIIPLGVDYALRAAFVLPSAVLIALSFLPMTYIVQRLLKLLRPTCASIVRTKRPGSSLVVLMLVIVVIASSALVTSYNYGTYLQPYAPPSVTQELGVIRSIIGTNVFPEPVFVFQGASILYLGSYRSYVGAKIGPNFAYYGSLENLLAVKPTNSTSSDPQIKSMENFWGSAYFMELTTGFSKTSYSYYHKDMISNTTQLLSHPIVVITPDFYGKDLPYYLLPFRIAQGVYVIPSGALNQSIMSPVRGPRLFLSEDGRSTSIYSQFEYLDPNSSQTAVVTVSPSPGATNYNLTGFPSEWRFVSIYQSGYLSAPEVSPVRLNGEPALDGNDPAENVSVWQPIGRNVSLTLSQDRREGASSLLISGYPDSFGNLGATYMQSIPADLVGQPVLAFWAKCDGKAALGLLLIDQNGYSRTYYDILAGGGSCNTAWQRFSVDLNTWSSETPLFESNHVSSFRLFSAHQASDVGFRIWLDDIILDKPPMTSNSIYKGRALQQDTLVFSFAASIPAASPLPAQPASPGEVSSTIIFVTVPIVSAAICLVRLRKTRRPLFPREEPLR